MSWEYHFLNSGYTGLLAWAILGNPEFLNQGGWAGWVFLFLSMASMVLCVARRCMRPR